MRSYSSSVSPSARWVGSSVVASAMPGRYRSDVGRREGRIVRHVAARTMTIDVVLIDQHAMGTTCRSDLKCPAVESGLVSMARRGPKEITDEHKAAMAAGRTEGRAIKNYLEALEQNRPKRGRRRTEESITARLAAIEDELESSDPVKKLNLVQERIDLTDELKAMSAALARSPVADFEAAFIEAKPSPTASERRPPLHAPRWREVGGARLVVLKADGHLPRQLACRPGWGVAASGGAGACCRGSADRILTRPSVEARARCGRRSGCGLEAHFTLRPALHTCDVVDRPGRVVPPPHHPQVLRMQFHQRLGRAGGPPVQLK